MEMYSNEDNEEWARFVHMQSAYQYPFEAYECPEPATATGPAPTPTPTPRGIAFYIHFADASRELPPKRFRSYRPKFTAESIAQKHQAAAEREILLKQKRVAELGERLNWVELQLILHRANRSQQWAQLQIGVIDDMARHVERRENLRLERLRRCRAHNKKARIRAELMRYGKYLESIVRDQEQAKQNARNVFPSA